MPSGLILAIDQGTSNTKALLVGREGSPVFRATSPLTSVYSNGGFVEQNPLRLWDSVLQAVAACTAFAGQTDAVIEAIAISNQRETAVAWNAETGHPVANAVSWQCGRAAGICNRLAPIGTEFRAKTGLPLAPLVSAGKWAWLLENDPAIASLASKGKMRFGTVDSWLLHQFTRGTLHATDFSNASRTGLLNLDSQEWDSDLLKIFGIPLDAMPALPSLFQLLRLKLGNTGSRRCAHPCRHRRFACRHVWSRRLFCWKREGHLWNGLILDGAHAFLASRHTDTGAHDCLVHRR